MQKAPPAQIAHGELLEVSVTGGQEPAAEVAIARHDRQAVLEGLRDHHAIKWVAMVKGKTLHTDDMCRCDCQRLRSNYIERGHDVIRQGKLA